MTFLMKWLKLKTQKRVQIKLLIIFVIGYAIRFMSKTLRYCPEICVSQGDRQNYIV